MKELRNILKLLFMTVFLVSCGASEDISTPSGLIQDPLKITDIVLSVTGSTSIAADGTATTILEAVVTNFDSGPLSGKLVSLSIPTDGGSVATNLSATNSSGIATFTLTSSFVPGLYSYRVSSEGRSSNFTTVTFSGDPIDSIVLTATGLTSINADGVSTTSFDATVLDASSNPLEGRSITLDIPTDGGAASTPIITNASGVASFTLTSSIVTGTYNFTASGESITSNSVSIDFVTIPVDSVTLAVTGATSILADGITTTTLEATVLDASSNPLSGKNVTLNIPTDGGTTTNPAITDALGVASFTLTSSTVPALYSYTATSEAVNSMSQDITFTPPIATINLVVTGATSIIADGVTTTTLEATALDASANPLSGKDITLNIAANGGTTVNPVTTNGSGVASFTLTSSLVPGVYSYTATGEVINSSAQNVTFTQMPVDSVNLVVTGAASISADGIATTTLEATVLDGSANPLSGRSVTLNIPTDGGTTVNPATTNGSGVASFTLTSSTVVGIYSYTATSESVNSTAQNVTFSLVAIDSVTLSVTGVTSIVADGITTTTLEATVLDASANPLSGKNVTLNIPTDGGTTVNPATTNGSGVASFTLTSSLVDGIYSYTATSEAVNSTSQNVTFTAVPVDSVSLAITGLTTIAADGTATTTLEALVEDASSNPLSGRSVTLNIPTNGGSTTNPTVTNGSGIAVFTLTSSTTEGLYSYTATSEGVNSTSQNITFVAPVATVTLSVTGSTSIAADGTSTTTIQALVEDAFSNPLSGRSVALNIPLNGGTTANPATTNGSGIATFTLTSSLIDGVYAYTATSESVNSGSQNITFTIPNAVLEWDVASYDYGSVSVAVTHTFTITNTGTATSGSMTVTKTGAGSKWAIITDNCTGITLAPAATCTVIFEYDGGRNPSGTQSGSLVLDATPGAAAVTVTTQGTTL